MQSIYQFPTIIIFAEGKGIATAKALIEASDDASGLNLGFRQQIRLYYRVSLLEACSFPMSLNLITRRRRSRAGMIYATMS